MKSEKICKKCKGRMELKSPKVTIGSIDEKNPKMFDDIKKVVPAKYKCSKCGHVE